MERNVFETHERLKRCPPVLLAYIFYRRVTEQGFRATWLWLNDKVKRRMLGFSPPEISRVTPTVYVGGQHKRHGLEAMRKQGITAILNMREEVDDAARGVLLDDYLWLPTTDDAPPSVRDLERGVDFVEAHAERGEGVYIHCASGVGRAPTMAAAYLIRQGATLEEAWARIRKGRPFIRPTPPQLEVISAFAARDRIPESKGVMQDTQEHQSTSPTTSQAAAETPNEKATQSGEVSAFALKTSAEIPSSEALDQRVQAAYERIAEDPNLTGALTDEAAQILLRWAEDEIRQMVATTAGLDEDVAQSTLSPKLRQLRRQVRDIAETAAASQTPVDKLQMLIDTSPTQEG